jgi:hypothetical protein
LTQENVNDPYPNQIPFSLGWSLLVRLRDTDAADVVALVALGLKKPPGSQVLLLPLSLLTKPRVLSVLLASKFEIESLLDDVYERNISDSTFRSYEPGIRLLFERGAALPRQPISAYQSVGVWIKLERIYQDVKWKRNRCRAAALAMCCLQRIRRSDRNVLGIITKFVWESRYDDAWSIRLKK